MLGLVQTVGRGAERSLAGFGDFWVFAAQTAFWFARSIGSPKMWKLLLPQAFSIGVQSVSVVAITGGFIGMILAVQVAEWFLNVGLEQILGAIINLAVISELAPVLGAIMMAGRVGSGLAAELGTMNVSEQIDALRVMGTDPIRYLVVPRVLACTLMTPLLIIIANFASVLGGAVVCINIFDVPSVPYWEFSAAALEGWDLWTPLVKATLFGMSIGLISCYRGFRTRGGAEGVGNACTMAFVYSFLAILVIDFFLNLLLKGMYAVFYPPKSVF